MDFFKSVFADDPEISETENAPTVSPNPNPIPNPDIPAISNAWSFGSTLFRTIASKSESVVQNYRRDIEEFSSGLKKETATIREVASRAVKDLPARFESGAAVAQESLESVGQAIDNIGSTVSEIIAHGKESILVNNDSDSELSENSSRSLEQSLNLNAKPYSRIDATIRAIQCDVKTYCDEPEDMIDYNEWKLGFVLEEMNGEIEDLIKENGVIDEIYSEVVPSRVDQESFWSRYFYKAYRIRKADEARARLVKRAISGEEEEELSWDVDDEDKEDTEGWSSRVATENVAKEEIEKKMDSLQVEDRGRRSVSGEDEKEIALETTSDGGAGRVDDAESKGDRGSSEGKNDNSDFSVVSSQLSFREGDDLGWDEIEDIASGDEIKVPERMSPSKDDLRKRLSAAEDEEELSWDVEDDDDEAAKS
ncbi:putative calcium-binding protein 39-like [Capsicum annuum]|uniref:BSD domain-containing protein 1 n=1 Tax=Capsicum annuum TaxID=4072 RepID=UPI0007BFD3EF|nr:BSD domain-containing protein 1 [Capsicum annuum]KAF3631040.1 putative calcium-binding protein 39-like [Capsicum annuum]